ncbi:MAG: hypothetical protein ACI93R_002455 [Flavobacteriales bacterium]|jgi:hypothetical protein
MSKIIHNKRSNDYEQEPIPVLLPLSPSVVVTHLKACQNLVRDHVQEAFDHYISSILEAFEIAVDKARSNQETTDFMDVQRRVKRAAPDLKHYYCGYYLEGFVKFSKKTLHTSVSSPEDVAEEDLSILGNEELEETIAITSITQRTDTYFAEPIWALNQRFSILNNGEPVTDAGNPLSPVQFCDALRRALKYVELTPNAKLIAYKVFDLQLISLYRRVARDVNDYLKQQGILPNLQYTLPRGRAPESYLHEDGDSFGRRSDDYGPSSGEEPNPEAPPEQYQGELMQAIRGLHQQIQYVNTNATQNLAPVSSEQLVQAIQLLQASKDQGSLLEGAQPNSLQPLNIQDSVKELTDQVSSEGENAEVEKQDMQTIEVVGMVFEYMLDDDNIPDSVKAILSYLHTPFLKIAFVDPGFFDRAEHPARVLLNTLADAGSQWVSNDGSSQFEMYEKIKELVNRLLKGFDGDIKLITTLLFEFSTYIKKVSRKQELTERRAKEKAEGEDKLREVKLKVNDEVRARTTGHELPSAILLLFLQPWSDYLTFILLRHGVDSDKWITGLALIEDVVWCIEPKHSLEEQNLLREKVFSVKDGLNQGFKVIGFDASKAAKLIEAFDSMTDMALLRQKAEPAPAPMRDELERIAAERAGNAVPEEKEVSPEELQMVESLKMIEFGTWFEFDGGKRLKVAWYNGRTSHYMLVDQMGKRVDMLSGLSMARKMISGDAKIISGSSKPFFERALENIYHKLHQKAEDLQPGVH